LSAAAVLQADSTTYDAQPKSRSIVTIEAAGKKPGREQNALRPRERARITWDALAGAVHYFISSASKPTNARSRRSTKA
jgi:hypothetical protein